ncbi:chloroplast stem-loop binding protein of 41 kDa, chloroplastic [Raphidocelis subcapitata]|uniref:Chloroplast stem-loop binding protein of 41 kDa, chloroplastic n=1 Tax=Raphidocelis subcapitata TaxID=307507 RepID=A0A2V0NYA3_9CHLO|nr:chloroplast stem-loop binding protein of 41 kDa, chloroplastic [Raphidocelis subcapitata]|eukprot:GBF92611.1 chloroplast stem-loop binding protein of 41 kDa, chloroplastic [Raphidocelis subcapitata]
MQFQAASGSRAFGAARASRRAAVTVRADKCLIVNTKGGGHAFIGYHLAKQLAAKGHDVTIFNDGDQAKLSAKAPFNQYPTLKGVKVAWGNPTDYSTFPEGPFDVVYDNNGKDLDSCKPLIDAAKGMVKHYVFVSSAGAYKADSIEPMHVEGDERKASAGHVAVENYLKEEGLPYTVFQPLYIYGPHTAKDCEQWFVDRVIRDRPVPIPVPGVQLVTLTHVEDVASMLAAVPGNKAAVGQHYNVCSDRAVTFQGIVKAVGKALGKEPKVVLYSPEEIGTGKSGKAEGFPFRTVHFFASSEKAKRELGWRPAHDFMGDVDALVKEYKASGRAAKEIDFSVDDKILKAVA